MSATAWLGGWAGNRLSGQIIGLSAALPVGAAGMIAGLALAGGFEIRPAFLAGALGAVIAGFAAGVAPRLWRLTDRHRRSQN